MHGHRTLGSDVGSPLNSGPSSGLDHLSEDMTAQRQKACPLCTAARWKRTGTCEKVILHGADEALLVFERRYYRDLLLGVEALLGLVFQCLCERVTPCST
jgi:hypothetical protein